MAYFRDEQDVYDHLGALFVALAEDAELAPALRAADSVVRYALRKPDAQITVDLRAGEPMTVDLGPSALEPDVLLTMDSDVAHRFWLGKVNPTFAFARGQIKVKGPLGKLTKLAPVVAPAAERYRASLQASGRSDLLAV